MMFTSQWETLQGGSLNRLRRSSRLDRRTLPLAEMLYHRALGLLTRTWVETPSRLSVTLSLEAEPVELPFGDAVGEVVLWLDGQRKSLGVTDVLVATALHAVEELYQLTMSLQTPVKQSDKDLFQRLVTLLEKLVQRVRDWKDHPERQRVYGWSRSASRSIASEFAEELKVKIEALSKARDELLTAYASGIRRRSPEIVQEELTKSDQGLQNQLNEIQSSQKPLEEELRQLIASRPELLKPPPENPPPENPPTANGADAAASGDAEQNGAKEVVVGFGPLSPAGQSTENAVSKDVVDLAATAPLKATLSSFETTARALQRFGDWKAERRSLDGAEAYYREALELFRDIYGAGAWNPDIANALQCLGTVNYHRKDLESAEELYMDALKMKRSVYGETARNIDIAETLNWLGNVQRDRKNLESAEKLFQEALYMKRDVHGLETKSADIAGSVHNLGTVKEGRKDYEGAEALYREALAMKRHVYGEGAKNTDIARTLYSLGVVLEMRYDLGSARNSYAEALQMCKALDDSKDSDNGGVVVALNAQAKLDFQKLIAKALWRVVFIRYGGRVVRALAIGVGIGLGLRIGAWSVGYGRSKPPAGDS